MPVRFLHTADWQLGMRRHFLKEEALPRFMQARIDAIGRIGQLAGEQGCEFVAVCGDVFESNQVDRRTVGRALEALEDVPCPVFLLPGNHDPLDAASLYRAPAFEKYALRGHEPVEVRPGLEVVGAPWRSKRPGRDPVAEALGELEPAPGVTRVLLGHGAATHPKPRIDVEAARQALADGRIDYLALGDRHSTMEVADRIWYSGTPEPTDYTEQDPGNVLLVELDGGECRVEKHRVGRWRFVRRAFELGTDQDLTLLAEWLSGLEGKDCTVLRLDLLGALSLGEQARLDSVLDEAADLFAAVEQCSDLSLRPEELELSELGLAGFARATALTLAQSDEEAARDALALLHRLAT